MDVKIRGYLPRKYGRFMLLFARCNSKFLLVLTTQFISVGTTCKYIEKTTFRNVFANNSVFNLHFMKVSTENDNNFGNEKITILVGNMPINQLVCEKYRACVGM
jgi:hypothetical protein